MGYYQYLRTCVPWLEVHELMVDKLFVVERFSRKLRVALRAFNRIDLA